MKQKTILLCVTSSVAAFKSVQLASNLQKKGYNIEVIMSKNATNFIQPLQFESLITKKVYVDTFAPVDTYDIHHISLAKKADLVLVCPATANIIAKLANGIADDMMSTTILATKAPVYICPAMNTNMYEHKATVRNIQTCREMGYTFVDPTSGLLACKDVGKGKLADLDVIEEVIDNAFKEDSILKGKRVLISAGPTQEALDPVRFLTNHSSGKMGYALAEVASKYGAEVTLVSGPVKLTPPPHIRLLNIISAMDLHDVMLQEASEADIIIMCAAVGDYRASHIEEHKIKKHSDTLTITLEKNPDILMELGSKKSPSQFLCGFAMETKDLKAEAKRKLQQKNCDMIVANSIASSDAGFGVDTNRVTLLTKEKQRDLGLLSKHEVAKVILETIVEIQEGN